VEIYIKPKKKAEVIAPNGRAYIKDIAEVYSEPALRQRVENIVILEGKKQGTYVVSVLKIIAAISAALPGHNVSNVGETDTLVVIKSKPAKKSSAWAIVKIAFICLILFAGSATAIMAFHTDSQLGAVFQQFHKIFVGEDVEKPLLINIPYSIGLALGIMLFFNHFAGKKFTKEPTPIQVEMEIYETDVEDALIQHIDRQEDKGGNE